MTTRRARRAGWIPGALLVASALACAQDEIPLAAQGERLELGSDLDIEICPGTVARLDRHILRVEAAMGLSSAELDRHRLDVVGDEAYREEFCSAPNLGGCYDPGDRSSVIAPEIFWRNGAGHELVHAIAGAADVFETNAFFREGLATHWGGGYCTEPAKHDLEQLLTPDADVVDVEVYEFAGRVVGHATDAIGTHAVLEMMSRLDRGDDLECTREVFGEYGLSLAELEEAGARDVYRPDPMSCDFVTIVPALEGETRVDLPLGCGDPEVYNTFSGSGDGPPLARSVVVEFPEDDPIDSAWDLRFLAPDHASVTISTCECPTDTVHHSEGYEFIVQRFPPGRYRFEVKGDEGDEIAVRIIR